jgi:hypothetical protein
VNQGNAKFTTDRVGGLVRAGLSRSRRQRWLAALAFPLLFIGATTSVGAETDSFSAAVPNGWRTYSGLGVQVAVPKAWSVRYFQNCPGPGPGTLLIGTPLVLDYCTNYPSNTNIVMIQAEKSGALPAQTGVSHLFLHGLKVIRANEGGYVSWEIPSRGVVVTAFGSSATSVVRTLARATPRARPAPGLLNGTEVLVALETIRITGAISVARLGTHGPALPPLHAFDGSFSATLPPGRYRLTGQAGDAPCVPVDVTVQSGRTSAPMLTCQGE